VSVPEFTEAEYTEHLDQEGWSRAETDHLFDLGKRFDLRFMVMHVSEVTLYKS
jgi:DNA methyltransferase 1-associated protein 1